MNASYRFGLIALLVLLSLAAGAPGVQAQGFLASFALSTINGSNGLGLDASGLPAPAGTEGRVTMTGDINGDGIPDMIVGLPFTTGQAFVVFGRTGGIPHPFDLSALDGSNGFAIKGVAAGDFAGSPVATGDINGDGVDDVIIAAPQADPVDSANPGGKMDAGAVYVVFGKTTGFAASLNLSALSGANGFVINGAANSEKAGSALATGDINGDGVRDLIIGAPFARPDFRDQAGSTYVVFGHTTAFAATFELSTLASPDGMTLNGVAASDFSGIAVAGSDFNADGIADIVIGAQGADVGSAADAGAVYVVFGHTGAFATSFELSAINGANGTVLQGVAAGDGASVVSGAGDINGDGKNDLLVGATGADPGANSRAGAAYVVFGHGGSFGAAFALSALDGSNGFTVNGQAANDFFGGAVGAAGDINGDGHDDFIVGAFNASGSAGRSYVVFGQGGAYAASLDLAALDGSNGFAISNDSSGFGLFGGTVSSAGDVNGDGVDDLIIGGAAQYAAYVIYGVSSASGATTVFSSVLPGARSGFTGGPVITVFASAINAGAARADNCAISVPGTAPVTLSYQPVNAANVPVGPPDTPFSINPGATRSFILAFTPTALSPGIDLFPAFVCDNASVAAISGVNTVFLTLDDHAVPDILSIGATPMGDGIVQVPSGGISFMSASATNIGAGDAAGSADAAVSVSVDDGGAALPLLLQICETDAAGTCMSPPDTAPVSTVIGAGPGFFAVFVSDQASGGIALEPATKRIFLRFMDASGAVRSVTSAAVTVP